MFDEVFVLTNGGPGVSSTNFGLYLFNLSFDDFRFGYASCVAYSVAIAVFGATVIINNLNARAANSGEGRAQLWEQFANAENPPTLGYIRLIGSHYGRFRVPVLLAGLISAFKLPAQDFPDATAVHPHTSGIQ